MVTTDATLSDSGPYTCTLKNDLGSDRVTFNVTVLDKPGQPEGPLEASDIKQDGCTLTWKAPKTDGNSPITNYVIEKLDPKKGVWEKVSSYCRSPTYEVMGLEEGKPYKFRVSAENNEGKSIPLETETTVTPKNPVKLPGAPTGLEAASQTAESVLLKWNPVPGEGINRIAGYAVEMCEPGSNDWFPASDATLVRDNQVEVTGLRPNREYKFRVKAKNAAGWGPASSDELQCSLKPDYVKPDAPGTPSVLRVGKNFAELQWTAPARDGGAKVFGYVVEKKQAGSDNWVKACSYNPSEPETRVDDLIENAVYEFRVKAVNKAGESEPSSTSGTFKISEYPNGVKPEFTKRLVDAEGSVGKNASFSVDFDGNPEPEVTWYKGGFEVFDGKRYKIDKSQGSSTLTFLDLSAGDNYSLSCTITNPLGKQTCEARLTIKAAPRLEKEPGDQTAMEGETVKIKIPIVGKGPFDFKLKKDGVPVNAKVSECDGIVTLTIPSTSRDDAGRYELDIANDSGSVKAPFNLKVKSPPGPPQGPMVINNVNKNGCRLAWKSPESDGGSRVTHYTVERRDCSKGKDAWVPYADYVKDHFIDVHGLREGGEFEFRVMAVNQNGTSAPLNSSESIVAKLPYGAPAAPGAPEVNEIGSDFVYLHWSKPAGDVPVTGYFVEKKEAGTDRWIRCNFSPTPSTTFNIPNLIEGKEYEFRVFAENEAGLSEPSMGSKSILVKDPNAMTSPVFTMKLDDVSANEGKTAYFECDINASPNTDVRFYRSGHEIFPGGRYSITNDGTKWTLAIRDVGQDDEDEYSVKAKNKGGSKMSYANLTIKSAPKIKLPERYQQTSIFEKDEAITIKIPYRADPKPTAKWYKDNEEIKPTSSTYSVELQSHFVTLRIPAPTTNQSGTYKLKLENPLGSDTCEFNVLITDVPGSPRFLVTESVKDESCSLSWKAPAYDGGSAITAYIVERLDLSTENPQWHKVSRTRLLHFTDEFLTSTHRYQFRITAENSQGASPPCEPTAVLTTLESDLLRRRKKWTEDENGKRRRGQEGQAPSDYDKCVSDPWARHPNGPQPFDYKLGSVYDFYDVFEELGSGAFGAVHRCVEKATGRTFAAKFIPTPSAAEKSTVKRECDMMNRLIHRKLLNLHDVFDEGDEMCLITEFLAGGELFEKISKQGYKMTEPEAKKYIRQVLEGLQHMHENNIVHLDIKPENIMFEAKNSTNVKIVDFGLATKLDPDEMVKVSAATVEFAAPEIVEKEAVGFATDMWAVGVLTYVILSGLSPFGGVDDNETSSNILDCSVQFPSSQFSMISDNGKDFIKKLLLRMKGSRMNVFEALDHPWLHSDLEDGSAIPSSAYDYINNKIKQKYSAWPEPQPAIGRLANFSSLKTHRPKEYSIYNSYFDRRDAAPRFVRKPRNINVLEGETAEFHCIIIAASPPVVTWFCGTQEIKQSLKFMKKYSNSSYRLEIKRCEMEDKGEYIIRAVNSYGEREYNPYLNVQPLPKPKPLEKREFTYERRVFQEVKLDLWQEPDCKATFTFKLRHRLIQSGIGVKLLCCLSGRPAPTVQWYKNGREISELDPHYSIEYSAGVCTLEINSCSVEDDAHYKCRCENALGYDETTCHLQVEG